MLPKYRKVALLLMAIGLIYAFALIFPLDTARQSAADTQNLITFMRSMGLQTKDAVKTIKLSQDIWPAFLVIFSAFFGYIIYTLGTRIGATFGYKSPAVTPFRVWRWNEWLVWGFILPALLLVFRSQLAGIVPEWLANLALNLMVIFSFVYLVQGLSVVSSVLLHSRLWPLARLMIYVLLLVQWPLLVVLGLLDVWLDFRKRLAKIS